jgi:hypothetical protein
MAEVRGPILADLSKQVESCSRSKRLARRAYRADLLRLGSQPLPGSLRELYYRRAACDGGGRGNLRSAGVDCQSIPTRPR